MGEIRKAISFALLVTTPVFAPMVLIGTHGLLYAMGYQKAMPRSVITTDLNNDGIEEIVVKTNDEEHIFFLQPDGKYKTLFEISSKKYDSLSFKDEPSKYKQWWIVKLELMIMDKLPEKNYLAEYFLKIAGFGFEILGIIGISKGIIDLNKEEDVTFLILGGFSYLVGYGLNHWASSYFSVYQSYHTVENYDNIFKIDDRISALEKKILGKSFDE